MAGITKEREEHLGKKEICRFCLSQQGKLGSIYVENARIKSSASLPLQIMAITSIEVNSEDGMPSFICMDCHLLFEHCYRFKQMCKRADTLLRQYPLTGQWPDALDKPRAPLVRQIIKKDASNVSPIKLLNSMAKPMVDIKNLEVMETKLAPTKFQNAKPLKIQKVQTLRSTASIVKKTSKPQAYQEKVDNSQELSMDDVQNLIADIANEIEDEESPAPAPPAQTSSGKSPTKPKLLNKSSMRILNKGATLPVEPRLALPQLKRDEAGNMAIVTEILDPNQPDSVIDPVKNASPVATNVFPCLHCDRSFPLLQLRDIHMASHSRTRSFQCNECDKSFFSKYDLQKHNFVHTGERPFKCSVCDKAFTRGALLHRHERTHTDIPKFICVYCEKPFISRAEMEKHAERHTKKRPFQCGVCEKSFAFKQGLERHEVVHSNDLPFPCQYCDQCFVTSGKLARHLVAHAGKRAYPCKYCSKSYLLSHHLSRHMRTHKQGSATFSCNACQEIFNSYNDLLKHTVTHLNETLTCPLCKEQLVDHDSIMPHMQAHRNSETYACEFCDLIYLSSQMLQKHIEDDHVVDMVPYQGNDVELEESIVKEEADLLQQLLDDDVENADQQKMENKTRRLHNGKKLSLAKKSSSYTNNTTTTTTTTTGAKEVTQVSGKKVKADVAAAAAKRQTKGGKRSSDGAEKQSKRGKIGN